MRELIVLGTASQVPTAHRGHNGYFLRWDGEGILFDPGEGTQRQMIHAGVAATDITRICITHFHGDHCLGLAGVTQRISLDSVPHAIPVHFPASGRVYYERLCRASIFAERERYEPRPIEADGVVHEDEALSIEVRSLDHRVDCFGYRVQERSAMRFRPDLLAAAGLEGPIVGRLQREGAVEWQGRRIFRHDVSEIRRRQSFAFVMDTRVCENAGRLAKGVDLAVLESTFLTAEQETAHVSGHLTASDAARIAKEAGVRRLAIGHFSQRHEDARVFLAEAQAIHADTVLAREPVPGDPQGLRHRIRVPERRDDAIDGDFQAIITVNGTDDARFEAACQDLGLEPLAVEAEPRTPATPLQALWRQRGDLPRVRCVVEGLLLRLAEAGLDARHARIETDGRTVIEVSAVEVSATPTAE